MRVSNLLEIFKNQRTPLDKATVAIAYFVNSENERILVPITDRRGTTTNVAVEEDIEDFRSSAFVKDVLLDDVGANCFLVLDRDSAVPLVSASDILSRLTDATGDERVHIVFKGYSGPVRDEGIPASELVSTKPGNPAVIEITVPNDDIEPSDEDVRRYTDENISYLRDKAYAEIQADRDWYDENSADRWREEDDFRS